MLNTQDAIQYLGVSRSRLYKFVSDQKLKIFKRKDNSKISYFSQQELDKIKDEFKEFVAVDPIAEKVEKPRLTRAKSPSKALNPALGASIEFQNENGAKPVSKKSKKSPVTTETGKKHHGLKGTKNLEREEFENSESDYFDHIINQISRERPGVDLRSLAAMGRVQRLAQFVDRRFEKIIAPYGLKQHEYLVLATIKREGAADALTPTEIYKSLAIPSGSITKRIDRLEAMGLVEREQNPQDRRGVKIRLTSKGLELVNQFENRPNFLYDEMVESLSAEEVAAFITTLRKLLRKQEQVTGDFATEKPY
jgi:DNA-binding MarR family transcriptional regulator